MADLAAHLLHGFGIVGLLAAVTSGAIAGQHHARRGRRRDGRASARWKALVHNSADILLVTDPDGVLVYASASFRDVLGDGPGATTVMADRIHPEDRARVATELAAVTASTGGSRRIEFRIRHADRSWRTVESAVTNVTDEPHLGLIWNLRQVTDRTSLEDELTGLANRTLLRDRLTHALARARRHHSSIGVLLFDLDRFQDVNDSLGDAVGDLVLIEVGKRIARCVRAEDTVARLGTDEFAVVFDDVPGPSTIDEMAVRILDVIHEPITIPGTPLRIDASCGQVFCPLGAADAQEVLRQADMAMHAAKARGRGGVVTFEPAMQDKARRRLHLALDLDRAVSAGELVLHYQPTVNLTTQRIDGAEALIRWNHPIKGLLAPMQFIPIAEETGAIIALGRWALQSACRQAVQWGRSAGLSSLSISVNVSSRQLLEGDLAADVDTALRDSNLVPQRLVLEITESVLMKDSGAVLNQLRAVQALGVRLAIDDFGTGYSSLAYLRQFPIDIIKIDKSFIDAIGQPHGGTSLVRAIVNLGNTLKLETIAEGIENPAQHDILRGLGCDAGQGFLFAQPMQADDFEALVQASGNRADVATTDGTSGSRATHWVPWARCAPGESTAHTLADAIGKPPGHSALI